MDVVVVVKKEALGIGAGVVDNTDTGRVVDQVALVVVSEVVPGVVASVTIHVL